MIEDWVLLKAIDVVLRLQQYLVPFLLLAFLELPFFLLLNDALLLPFSLFGRFLFFDLFLEFHLHLELLLSLQVGGVVGVVLDMSGCLHGWMVVHSAMEA